MNYIDYYKSQAKKLYKDFQTQYKIENDIIYDYKPKFWHDINHIILYFDIEEDNFSLMKAQHYVAKLANFNNWNELIHSSEYQLELGFYLIEYRENDLLDEWKWYESYAELDRFDDYGKLEIFKEVFLKNIINEQITELMHKYETREIDGSTYFKKIMELTTSSKVGKE